VTKRWWGIGTRLPLILAVLPATAVPSCPTRTPVCDGNCSSPADLDDCAACCPSRGAAEDCCASFQSPQQFRACLTVVHRQWPASPTEEQEELEATDPWDGLLASR